MNHPLALNGNDGSSSSSAGRYWEEAIALGIRLGTLLQTLVIPLLVAIGVQCAVQLYVSIRREASRQLERHVETLQRDRQRLIEEIKIDLLRTLNKGAKEESTVGGGGSPVTPPLEEERSDRREQPVLEKKLDPSSSSPARVTNNGPKQSNGQPQNCRTVTPPTVKPSEWVPSARQLDRKDRSNIVNEIIYQIQSGSRTANDNVRSAKAHGEKVVESPTGGSAEDTAVLRDVHRRNVVARMKTLFEQEKPSHSPAKLDSIPARITPERKPSSVQPSLRHFSSVVNIRRRNEPPHVSNPSRAISASLENLRPSGGGQFAKASSEPPTVIRLRRRIRSQHSLSESVEDILESERFSKRLSQYSISDLLDEEENDDVVMSAAANGQSKSVPYDRVSRGLKTLSTFSLSELLQDEETMTVDGGVEAEPEVVLRNAKPTSQVPASYRNAVDNIEQILVAENLSKDYWKYSISNLLDFMEEEGGGLVALEEYSQYGDMRQST
uniref:Uncharacterized protein n=1 Tax=Anopheles farauti TaxID=69004 RepID=A0A182QFL3_9DIPT